MLASIHQKAKDRFLSSCIFMVVVGSYAVLDGGKKALADAAAGLLSAIDLCLGGETGRCASRTDPFHHQGTNQ